MTPAEVDERTPGDVPVYSVGTLVSPRRNERYALRPRPNPVGGDLRTRYADLGNLDIRRTRGGARQVPGQHGPESTPGGRCAPGPAPCREDFAYAVRKIRIWNVRRTQVPLPGCAPRRAAPATIGSGDAPGQPRSSSATPKVSLAAARRRPWSASQQLGDAPGQPRSSSATPLVSLAAARRRRRPGRGTGGR